MPFQASSHLLSRPRLFQPWAYRIYRAASTAVPCEHFQKPYLFQLPQASCKTVRVRPIEGTLKVLGRLAVYSFWCSDWDDPGKRICRRKSSVSVDLRKWKEACWTPWGEEGIAMEYRSSSCASRKARARIQKSTLIFPTVAGRSMSHLSNGCNSSCSRRMASAKHQCGW